MKKHMLFATALLALEIASPMDSFGGGVDLTSMGPTPLGYTEGEWAAFVENAIETTVPVSFGGLTVRTVEIQAPLVFEGDVPSVELVPLSEAQMDALGITPGDFAEDSTSQNVRVFYHEEPASDDGEDEALSEDASWEPSAESSTDGSAGTDSLYYCPPPYYCQVWNNVNGSGLLYNKYSLIRTISYSMDAATTHPRYGEACFSGGTACLPVAFAGTTGGTILVTSYAYFAYIYFNGYVQFIWFVADPGTWVDEGENAWDSIVLHGDAAADNNTNRIRVTNVKIWHNATSDSTSYIIGEEPDDFTLDAANPTFNLTPELNEKKFYARFTVPQSTVVSATSDWYQGANIFYRVYPQNDPDFGGALAPKPWCTEFVSWAFRENYGNTLGNCQGCEHLPEINAPLNVNDARFPPVTNYNSSDISVIDFYYWSDAVGRRLFYGNDVSSSSNGPTVPQWQALASSIGAGDYVAYRQCNDFACSSWQMHSEITIGWSNAAQTGVGAGNFSSARECNLLQTVSGNLGAAPGRVVIRGETICRRPVWNGVIGQWMDPPCDIDADGVVDPDDQCDIRLWDPNLGNGEDEGGFFATMP